MRNKKAENLLKEIMIKNLEKIINEKFKEEWLKK